MSQVLVIRDGIVVTTHRLEQWDDVATKYPGAEVVKWYGEKVELLSADPRAIDNHRAAKLEALAADMLAAQTAGVTVGELTLAATIYAQNRFAALLVGVTNALELGAMKADSAVTIWDATGESHVLTVAQYKASAAGYMAACQALEQRLAIAQTAVAAAKTIELVKAVTF